MRNVVITTAFAVLTAPWMSAQTNVTTTVRDYNGTSLLLMRSDDYNGSGCGGNCAIYSSQKGNGGKYTLQSEIDSKGSWQLFLFNQSVRTLYITPNEIGRASCRER